jgi:Anti-sigma-K factor rskA
MRGRRADKAGGDENFELAALADGSLSPERRSLLEERVAASPELSERLAEQQQALALARGAVEGVEAPQALRTRIERQQRTRSRGAPRRLVAISAAAAAVGAVAIGVVALNSGGSGARFRAALAPTSLAPDASGEATLTRRSSGWQIELDAKGLPRLAGGRFYEAWLRNAAGVLVPVGTFNEGRHVTLWAGVAPTAFTTLTVTRERADGDQTSSGAKVLVGTVKTSG